MGSSRKVVTLIRWSNRWRNALITRIGKEYSRMALEPEIASREKALDIVRCSLMNSFLGINPESGDAIVAFDGMSNVPLAKSKTKRMNG